MRPLHEDVGGVPTVPRPLTPSGRTSLPWIVLLLALCAVLVTAQSRTPSQRFQDAISVMETKGDYQAAIRLFEEIVKGSDRNLAARSLVYIGLCYEKLRTAQAQGAYQRVIRDFRDQADAVAQARARLAALGPPGNANALASRRIWDGAGVEGYSALSPDGQRLSFIDNETGDLALLDLSSGQKRHLTKNVAPYQPGLARFSLHSPDGKSVAYVWMTPDQDSELRVVGVDASASRLVYRNADLVYPEPVDWSSDGARILVLFHRKDNTNQIAIVSVQDGSARVIKTLDWRYPDLMSLSPDGRFIAYDFPPREDSLDRDISLIATDGSQETTLVGHPANDSSPLWTPDGQQVIFISDRTGTIGAWAVKVAHGRPQGAPQMLRPDMGRSWPLRFGRNGSYYYAVLTGLRDTYTAVLDPETGKLLAGPAPVSRRLAGSNQWPEWSPDGRSLAYTSGRVSRSAGQTPSLIVQSVEDGKIRELVPPLGFLLRPRWRPDGRSILVTGGDHKNRGGLYLIDVQTGETTPAPVAQTAGPGEFPRQGVWAPDGKSIFYNYAERALRLRELDTGQEREISTGAIDFSLSPDGQSLAITVHDQTARSKALKIIPVTGGPGRELLREPGSGALTSGMAWTPDGRHLLFTKVGGSDLWWIPVAGGEPQKLGLTIDGLSDIRMAPDGRRIAFTAGKYSAEIWEMKKLFSPAGQPPSATGR